MWNQPTTLPKNVHLRRILESDDSMDRDSSSDKKSKRKDKKRERAEDDDAPEPKRPKKDKQKHKKYKKDQKEHSVVKSVLETLKAENHKFANFFLNWNHVLQLLECKECKGYLPCSQADYVWSHLNLHHSILIKPTGSYKRQPWQAITEEPTKETYIAALRAAFRSWHVQELDNVQVNDKLAIELSESSKVSPLPVPLLPPYSNPKPTFKCALCAATFLDRTPSNTHFKEAHTAEWMDTLPEDRIEQAIIWTQDIGESKRIRVTHYDGTPFAPIPKPSRSRTPREDLERAQSDTDSEAKKAHKKKPNKSAPAPTSDPEYYLEPLKLLTQNAVDALRAMDIGTPTQYARQAVSFPVLIPNLSSIREFNLKVAPDWVATVMKADLSDQTLVAFFSAKYPQVIQQFTADNIAAIRAGTIYSELSHETPAVELYLPLAPEPARVVPAPPALATAPAPVPTLPLQLRETITIDDD